MIFSMAVDETLHQEGVRDGIWGDFGMQLCFGGQNVSVQTCSTTLKLNSNKIPTRAIQMFMLSREVVDFKMDA